MTMGTNLGQWPKNLERRLLIFSATHPLLAVKIPHVWARSWTSYCNSYCAFQWTCKPASKTINLTTGHNNKNNPHDLASKNIDVIDQKWGRWNLCKFCTCSKISGCSRQCRGAVMSWPHHGASPWCMGVVPSRPHCWGSPWCRGAASSGSHLPSEGDGESVWWWSNAFLLSGCCISPMYLFEKIEQVIFHLTWSTPSSLY